MKDWDEGMQMAGEIVAARLDQHPPDPPAGRDRHAYGDGPFAVLKMPPLPDSSGLYLLCVDGAVVYVGHTRKSLRNRLVSNGLARISHYSTLSAQPGRTNGGQQTHCRVNALANRALRNNRSLTLLYKVTEESGAHSAKTAWMRRHGSPTWNLQGPP